MFLQASVRTSLGEVWLAMQMLSLGMLLGLWYVTRADSYEEGVEHGIGD